VKNIVAVLLMIFILCIPKFLSCQSFSQCSPILDSKIYPHIQKYINDLNIKHSINNDYAKQIVNDVYNLILKDIDENNMIPTSDPSVFIMKYTNEIRDVYFLNTVIILFDGQQSRKKVCITSILFEKRFLLYIHEKGKIEV
jgi:hypothetical protein